MAESWNYYGPRGNTTDVTSPSAPETKPYASTDTGMKAYLDALAKMKYQTATPSRTAQEARPQAVSQPMVQRRAASAVPQAAREQVPRVFDQPIQPMSAGGWTSMMGRTQKMVEVGGRSMPFEDYLALTGKGSGGTIIPSTPISPAGAGSMPLAPYAQETANRTGLSPADMYRIQVESIQNAGR
jgi:hypothetical protein